MGASGVGRLGDGGIGDGAVNDGGRPLGTERQDVDADRDVDDGAIGLDLRKLEPSVDLALPGGNVSANGAELPRPSGIDSRLMAQPRRFRASALCRPARARVCLVLLPLMALIAVAIKVSSPGPVLHRSHRVGRDGRVFEFWKFRSMYAGAEQDRSSVAHLNEATGPVFKITDDPRVTPVGRLLRRSSLDEIPQLVHVVSGRMSLVGPRPPLPDEVATYDTTARRRLAVRPGLTCIWQTSGRSDIGFDAWIQMDIEYIETWSLGKDVKLIVRTIPAVLGGRGAY